MAKRHDKKRRDKVSFERNLRWYLVTAYILSTVGLLPRDKELKLAHLAEQASGRARRTLSWKEEVRQSLGVADEFITRVFELCCAKRGPVLAVYFLLRGFGCPAPTRRVKEVLGLEP